jgi:hypothetical protein
LQYLNASHLFCFAQLNTIYQAAFPNPIEFALRAKLLNSNEIALLTRATGASSEQPQDDGAHWSIGLIHAQLCIGFARQLLHSTCEDGTITPPLLFSLNSELNKVLAEMQEVYGFREQPIPYIFFHYACQTLTLTVFLLAYAAGSTEPSVEKLVAAALTALMLLGLREVACLLADPWGADMCDIPGAEHVLSTILDSEQLITSLVANAQLSAGARASARTGDASQPPAVAISHGGGQSEVEASAAVSCSTRVGAGRTTPVALSAPQLAGAAASSRASAAPALEREPSHPVTDLEQHADGRHL